MSVGFIGAGQLAHALVKGFTAAGEATLFILHYLPCTEMLMHFDVFLVVLLCYVFILDISLSVSCLFRLFLVQLL